jgi:hypothetical protein
MYKAQATVRNEVSGLYTRARTSHRKFWWNLPELPVKRDQTVGLVSQLGFTGTSGARTKTCGPYRNFQTEPGTILSHVSARANCTNRNFRCLTGTSGPRPEQFSRTRARAGASDWNFWCGTQELPVHVSPAY